MSAFKDLCILQSCINMKLCVRLNLIPNYPKWLPNFATVLPSCLSYCMFVKVTLTVGQEIVEKHGLCVREGALTRLFSDSRSLPWLMACWMLWFIVYFFLNSLHFLLIKLTWENVPLQFIDSGIRRPCFILLQWHFVKGWNSSLDLLLKNKRFLHKWQK